MFICALLVLGFLLRSARTEQMPATWAEIAATHLVAVHATEPRYLEFVFKDSEVFEPIALFGIHYSGDDVREMSFDKMQKQQDVQKIQTTFRNTKPVIIYEDDVFEVDLMYKNPKVMGQEMNLVHFKYKYNNKHGSIVLFSKNAFPRKDDSKSLEHNIVELNEIATMEDLEKMELLKYQQQLLATALRMSDFNKRLLLVTDGKSTSNNAVDFIRDFITDVLELPQFAYNIYQAKYRKEGLLFEMNTAQAAIEVLTKARLSSTREKDFTIETSLLDFYDNTVETLSVLNNDTAKGLNNII